jgi:magnesium-protoporphyrin O-methyltransferase
MRRSLSVSEAVQRKDRLRLYFDGIGFERWSAIYGQEQLSPIRRSIRDGHAAMLGQAASWLEERHAGFPNQPMALDAGCGTGLFTIALAKRGFRVTAVDIAPQMVAAAQRFAQKLGIDSEVEFAVGDLETITNVQNAPGAYDVVCCFDVLIHYPQSDFVRLCTQLATLSRNTLLLTYAPFNPMLAAMHRLGRYFPKNHRHTDIQMMPDHVVEQTLAAAGMQIQRRVRVSKGFYHVTLLEATR